MKDLTERILNRAKCKEGIEKCLNKIYVASIVFLISLENLIDLHLFTERKVS